ncbi:hypothetical protein GR140_18755 [Pseudomonas putida]|uniref:hypothetical protein n=1 Tax=Pseudomonas putida TaxID=303 RepID=UPI001BAEFD8B|nr:hypothetical protein [Pseudomonas putida]QUG90705.1 hypothetical protein GR140_18755 [Pseudomonas putida]
MTEKSFEDLNAKLGELLEIYKSSTSKEELESSFLKKFSDDDYEQMVELSIIKFMTTQEERYLELYHAFIIAIKNATSPHNELYPKMFNMGLSYFQHNYLSKDAFVKRIESLVNKVKFQGKEYTAAQIMELIEGMEKFKLMMFDFILNPESTKTAADKKNKSVRKYIETELNK